MKELNDKCRSESFAEDFTIENYRRLICLAKKNYKFISYDEIAFDTKFILWRHDCDCSLNRAYRMAVIEKQENIRSTFFLNPHSEFYNPFEKSQAKIIESIIDLGHDVGLHFDAEYYDIKDEGQLNDQVASEAKWIEDAFAVNINSFSFHNPTEFLLTCEEKTYGGLINCYSSEFKEKISYCSDSNGHWRFRRLEDVLQESNDTCLQILTHPVWWQDDAIPPRWRVFRSVYGRASNIMNNYDSILESFGRNNLDGMAGELSFMKLIDRNMYELCDFLWHNNNFETLFLELWNIFERQVDYFCLIVLKDDWGVAEESLKKFFDTSKHLIDARYMFDMLFDGEWEHVIGDDENKYDKWMMLKSKIDYSYAVSQNDELENGCVYLCGVIRSLVVWGGEQSFHANGKSDDTKDKLVADSGFVKKRKTQDHDVVLSKARWQEFKNKVLNLSRE